MGRFSRTLWKTPVVYDEIASRDNSTPAAAGAVQSPKILCLGGTHDAQVALRDRCGEEVEVVEVSPARALAHLGSGEYIGIYADADHFAEVIDVARLVQNERILQGMPDGVVLLGNDNTILWGNGRLREWTGRRGHRRLEFLRSDGHARDPRARFLSVPHGPYHRPRQRLDACGVFNRGTCACTPRRCSMAAATPQHLVVTIRDVTDEVLQQQKLSAIHQAGIELADLTPDEVAKMTIDERIELLKANILHCTQDVLHYDVVEIRMLDPKTRRARAGAGRGHDAGSRRTRSCGPNHGNGVTGFVAATGKSYLCEDTSEDPLYLEGAPGARSSLTVPVMLHDRVTGTFNVESPEAAGVQRERSAVPRDFRPRRGDRAQHAGAAGRGKGQRPPPRASRRFTAPWHCRSTTF